MGMMYHAAIVRDSDKLEFVGSIPFCFYFVDSLILLLGSRFRASKAAQSRRGEA